MADEVRRVAKKGCHAVTFSENPAKLGWPHIFGDHWDPFFAGVRGRGHRHLPAHRLVVDARSRSQPGAPIDVMITLTPLNTHARGHRPPVVARCCASSRTCSSRCREGGTGWIPYWLERIDYMYQQHRFWTGQDFGDQLPSQVARDHFSFCFISDRAGVDDRDEIGVDNDHVGVRLPALRLDVAALAGVAREAARRRARRRGRTR